MNFTYELLYVRDCILLIAKKEGLCKVEKKICIGITW